MSIREVYETTHKRKENQEYVSKRAGDVMVSVYEQIYFHFL